MSGSGDRGDRGDRTPRVAVALCDRGHDGHASPRAEHVADLLARCLPGTPVAVVADLCVRPDRLLGIAASEGADRLVAASCGPGPGGAERQALARKAGLDPFAIEAVDVDLAAHLARRGRGGETVAASVAAAVASALAAARTDPTMLRPTLPAEGVSRRTLLTSGPVSYRPVAAVDRGSCLGTRRCGLCAPACPVDAIRRSAPVPSVVTESCIACGACVTACPVGAVGLPGADVGRIVAKLDALRVWPWEDGAPGLLLMCPGAARRAPRAGRDRTSAGWVPVALGCLSALTHGMILGTLAAGAPAVALLGCGTGCDGGSAARTGQHVGHARAFLAAIDDADPASRVRVCPADDPDPLVPLDAPLDPPLPSEAGVGPALVVEPAATADAVRRLVGVLEPSTFAVPPVQGGPLGVLDVDREGCTLCGICAGVCPTGALAFAQADGSAELSFDGSRCVACGHCVDICPERVVSVRSATDLASVLAGRSVVKHGAVVACSRCGRPVAPAAMLERLRDLLPDESRQLLDLVGGVCVDCRGR